MRDEPGGIVRGHSHGSVAGCLKGNEHCSAAPTSSPPGARHFHSATCADFSRVECPRDNRDTHPVGPERVRRRIQISQTGFHAAPIARCSGAKSAVAEKSRPSAPATRGGVFGVKLALSWFRTGPTSTGRRARLVIILRFREKEIAHGHARRPRLPRARQKPPSHRSPGAHHPRGPTTATFAAPLSNGLSKECCGTCCRLATSHLPSSFHHRRPFQRPVKSNFVHPPAQKCSCAAAKKGRSQYRPRRGC